jgi:hypothetical protein
LNLLRSSIAKKTVNVPGSRCTESAGVKTCRPEAQTPRPQGAHIDLSATYFLSGDWSGINFTGMNLENIRLNWTDLKNAELEGVTQFTGAYLYRTAWWQARSINLPLREYLKVNFQFTPGAKYGPARRDRDAGQIRRGSPTPHVALEIAWTPQRGCSNFVLVDVADEDLRHNHMLAFRKCHQNISSISRFQPF